MLVREQDQEALRRTAVALGIDPVGLLEQARLGLVSGVRHACLGCVILAIIGYFISRRLPPFTGQRSKLDHTP